MESVIKHTSKNQFILAKRVHTPGAVRIHILPCRRRDVREFVGGDPDDVAVVRFV